MKIAICGSRWVRDEEIVHTAMFAMGDLIYEPVECWLTGGSSGVYLMAELAAKKQIDDPVPVKILPADWKTYGKAAGPIRNAAMIAQADALVAVWDGESPGTRDTILRACAKGIPVYIHPAGKKPLTTDAPTA